MIHNTKETVTEEVVRYSHTTCDRCKEEIHTGSMYIIFEAEFSMRIGESYPEGGNDERTTIDMCQACAEGALNLLKAAGFTSNTEESDW